MEKARIFNIIFIFIISLLTLPGCTGDDNNKVLAEVNGKDITKGEFTTYLKYKHVPEKDARRIETELDNYLQREALAMVMTEQDVLDEASINVEINEFRKQMIISRYFEKYLASQINEQAIKNYYATNQEKFQSRKVHVAHILIRTNSGMTEQERQALLTKAQEVYSRAEAKEDFTELAQKYSDDKLSAKKGGDLGWILEGSIDPVFSNTAFELKKDEVSKPVTTAFGFHIIKGLEEAKVITRPFDKVSGDIRYQLRQQAKQAEMERLKAMVKITKKENYDAQE